MTNFIIGKAYTDVSGRLYQQLTNAVESGKNVLMLVPDQFEFETEKALYSLCEKQGHLERYADITVRTFSKLSDEIIARYGTGMLPADDITKNVIM